MTSILLYSIDSLNVYNDKYVKKYDIVLGTTDEYSIVNYNDYLVWKFIDRNGTVCMTCYFKKIKKVCVINESFNESNHIVYRDKLMIFVPTLQQCKIYKKNGTCIVDTYNTKDLSHCPVGNIYAALKELNYSRAEYGSEVQIKNMVNATVNNMSE